MSRASRARSSAAPTAATAPATSCWARTVLATAARTTEPITPNLTTRAGVPATSASQPCRSRERPHQRPRRAQGAEGQRDGQHHQEAVREEQPGEQCRAHHGQGRRLRGVDRHQQRQRQRGVDHGQQRVTDEQADRLVAQTEDQTGQGEQQQADQGGRRRRRTGHDRRRRQQQADEPGVEDPTDQPQVARVVDQLADARSHRGGRHGDDPGAADVTAATPSGHPRRVRSRWPTRRTPGSGRPAPAPARSPG